ncbi:MAG TPA: type IV toxin-antitoxin system AbiEi family antitoxin [Gammaproteobacteria bacterium]|jgi:predicted transcriptional regulator of viral defense system|nr:type IV toxin-antitoxin system AbiEi family antitoxin [Gammaproteobacteria bacterium]
MHISDFLTQLIAKGSCTFTFSQAKEALGASNIATKAAIRRLKQKGQLASPLKSFYVIVPPQYRILGCRPADQFIHDLMQFIDTPYYVGLLSAAQYYGAAHHRPQQLQVITNQKRPAILCGRIKIVFVTKKNIQRIPTKNFNTSQGIIVVSSPEATAMDMVTYPNRCAGLDNVLIVLNDLVKKLDADKLLELTINSAEATWIQRLGYLLDLIKANNLSDILLNSLKHRRIRTRLLTPPIKISPVLEKLASKLGKTKPQKMARNNKWKLIINKKLELEI